MNTVYIETSIVSYLRQRPSAQVVMAARQLLTSKWWETERTNYELVVSQYVLDEASGGDPILAAERIQALAGIPLLPNAPQITHIANAKILPRIHQVLTDAGVPIPVIYTPEELLGNDSEIDD